MMAPDMTDRKTQLYFKLKSFLIMDIDRVYLSPEAPEGYDKLFQEWDELRKKANEEDDGLDW